MKKILISDITLGTCAAEKNSFTFREKIEVAKQLDKLCVSVIELGTMSGNTADNLLIKSVASSVTESTVAVSAGFDTEAIKNIWSALKEAKHPRLQICGAVSTARMEYVYHKKLDAMAETVTKAVAYCKTLCNDVEFIAEDATRADFDFLCRIISDVIKSGAATVTICDTAGIMLPDEFGAFIEKLYGAIPELNNISVGVNCSDVLLVANAASVAAIMKGANEIKVSALEADTVSLNALIKLLVTKSDMLGVVTDVKITEINRILKAIQKLGNKTSAKNSPFEDGVRTYPEDMVFTANDSINEIVKGCEFLGYTLDDTDKMRIWKAFNEIAQRITSVSIGELEAIIASEAMQVPATYTLENFVVTTGNAIDILAHVKLKRGDKILDGLSLGDGPIDAAFLAIEKITGHHYELDDFKIQAITEGREAMGQTIVKLRSGGKVYAGKGISTDIIGSGVAAYVNALNKIIYEEENA
ncbi:MAG: hypothetical protein KBS52_06585 [Clostridiales bacterium]|nr:hypothetical protein [Candidatus Equinaster intestinalis]